jgi:hypothetical protein
LPTPITTTRPPAGDLLAGATGTAYAGPVAGTFGTRGNEQGLFPAELPPVDPESMDASFRQSSADQACCCVARPVIRVVMPPTADRPHETELLLCGHHYRISRAALAAAHASAHELSGNFADPSYWFHDDRGQRAQASVARDHGR